MGICLVIIWFQVRSEKVSESMKILQKLVHSYGNWKGLMLDEIINYVHSLQNQVEVTLLLKNLINIVIMN